MTPARPRRPLALLALTMLVVLPCRTWAGTSAPGVNLRWDRCFADGGTWNKVFACDSNGGSENLVGTFELAQPLTDVVSVEVVLDLRSESPTLPAWWSLAYSGGCRSGSMDFRPDAFPLLEQCTYDGVNTGGGLAAYSIGLQGPSHVRLTGAFATPTLRAANLASGIEYYAFSVLIDHRKTVGTGACGGCQVPVCAFLSRISLYQRGANTAAINLQRGANWSGSQYVTWQNGYPVDVHYECDPSAPACTPCSCACTRRPWWS